MTKQRKISIPKDELEQAKIQAEKDGFGENVTGWVRWLIRGKCQAKKEPVVAAQS